MPSHDLAYRVWMGFLRALARVLLGAAYRFEWRGISSVPREGGVIVVVNHTSVHDWLFVGAAMPRAPRFVMHQHHFQYPALRAFFEASRVIPIAPRKEDPARVDAALEEIDRALERGELVVLFPEGTMTADGSLGEIRPGIERMVARRAVSVVPIAIEGLFGSALSRAYGPPLSTWPRRFRARVVLRAGAPIPPCDVTTSAVRERLTELLALR